MQQPPLGFKQHPIYPELAANEEGKIMRFPLRLLNADWRLVVPMVDGAGYLALQKPRKIGMILAHHVVFECFNGVRDWSRCGGEGNTINHINKVRTDNRLSNLECISLSDNVRKATNRVDFPKYIYPSHKRFRIQIKLESKEYVSPSFTTIEEAKNFFPQYIGEISRFITKPSSIYKLCNILKNM